MKDATGELSMTAVAVVAIAAIGVVFSTLIWPTIKSNISRSTLCSQAFNCDCSGGTGVCTCDYINDKGEHIKGKLSCPDNNSKDGTTAAAGA